MERTDPLEHALNDLRKAEHDKDKLLKAADAVWDRRGEISQYIGPGYGFGKALHELGRAIKEVESG